MSNNEELDILNPLNATPISCIEAPTPHKISVLLLVQIYLKVKRAAATAGIIHSAKTRQHFCMLLLKLIQYPDMSYKDLHSLLTSTRYKIDSHHMEMFEKNTAELFSLGVDALLDFAELQNIEKMLAEETGVSQFSVVGLYIRRIGVIMERMSFAELLALYRQICLYYEKGLYDLEHTQQQASTDILEDKSTSLSTPCFYHDENEDSILGKEVVYQDRNSHCKWSPRQADMFVIQQCDLLECNEQRASSPIDLQTKLNEIIESNPLNKATYFLAYLNQVRLLDYFGAKDALHRTFDRCPTYTIKPLEQKGFQYFCANLAVMQANFDHHEEALRALKESVMLAQEIRDKNCLHLVNLWYCLLNGTQIDPVERCLPKLLEPSEVQPISLVIQFVVKYGTQYGFLPLDNFELIRKSEEVNSTNSLLEYFPDLIAMRSALWCLYGRYEMSAAYAQLLLNLRKSWADGDVGNSECVAKTLSSLVLWVNTQGEHQLSNVLMQQAKARFKRFPNAKNWSVTKSLVNIQERTHCRQWHEAQTACCNLYIFDKNMANHHRAAILLAKGHLCMGRRILINLLNSENINMLTKARTLILLAQIMISSKTAIFSGAIPLLVQASILTASTYMEYENGVIDMTLANVLLSMNMSDKAFQAITNSMQKIYTNGDIYKRSKMDFIFVRAYFAAARGNKTEQLKRLLRSISMLEYAIENFHSREKYGKALNVMVFIAKSFNELQRIDERNKYAARFKQYYLEHSTSRECLGIIL